MTRPVGVGRAFETDGSLVGRMAAWCSALCAKFEVACPAPILLRWSVARQTARMQVAVLGPPKDCSPWASG